MRHLNQQPTSADVAGAPPAARPGSVGVTNGSGVSVSTQTCQESGPADVQPDLSDSQNKHQLYD